MRSQDTALLTFLASTKVFIKAHLLTITLAGGAVLRYCDLADPYVHGGSTFAPLDFAIKGLRQSLSLSVDAVEIDIGPRDSDLVSGVPLAQFAARSGFVGAEATLTRLFAVDFPTLRTSGPAGAVVLMAGRLSETTEGGANAFTLRIAAFTELLDQASYQETYSPGCRNVLFDARCGVSKAAYQVDATVAAGSDARTLATNLTQAAGYFDLGFVEILSGPAAGQKRTIRTHSAGGGLTLLPGLTVPPGTGAAIRVVPGCARTLTDCVARYNNRAKFRGEPFIPAPETAI